MKKKILALLLAVVMAAGCCACGGGSDDGGAASSEGGNVVAIAMGSGFDTMDPGYCYEKYPALVINACYETLFKFYSNDGAAEPCLAETYAFSDD
ncbi:MAG: ABC transporter substrate-binding protein, partial [Ruminiclostridium sp.]|nr:ABC transporter substrate-binding protein [Ruminiclostridium sp.]